MQLGRIIGNVVCTMKTASLEGRKLLLVQPIDKNGRDKGRAFVAVDAVGAGAGETIYWCRGREASFPFLPADTPTEATIVGIVDTVNILGAVGSSSPDLKSQISNLKLEEKRAQSTTTERPPRKERKS